MKTIVAFELKSFSRREFGLIPLLGKFFASENLDKQDTVGVNSRTPYLNLSVYACVPIVFWD